MTRTTPNRLGLFLFATIYITAGIGHFVLTPLYMSIMPPYLSAHRELVLISGIAETLGGLGVLYPPTRRLAAWGVVALLIAVIPANIYMLQVHDQFPNIPLWALWLRLPLQIALIAWAWQYTRTTHV